MSQLLQVIHHHLKAKGYRPKLTWRWRDGQPIIIDRNPEWHHITERPGYIQLRSYNLISTINKADPELLIKITNWWDENRPNLEQILQ